MGQKRFQLIEIIFLIIFGVFIPCSLLRLVYRYSYILVLSLLSRGLDITWLFQGLEDFRKITVRNITVKLIGVISIFLFIKSQNDLYLYVFLLTIFEFLGQLSIVNILLPLVTSLGSVMLPRVSNLLSSGDNKSVNRMNQLSFLIYNLVIFPTIAGMLIINNDFVKFFLGEDFQESKYAIAIMIFRMFFIGWTNIMGIQILIPHNKNKEFLTSTTVPAIISVGLNLLLLPEFGYIGAAIVSVLTEVFVWVIQLYFTRKYLKDVPIFKSTVKIFLASILMYVALSFLKSILTFTPIVNVVVCAIVGAILYGLLILLFKVVSLKEIKEQLLKN